VPTIRNLQQPHAKNAKTLQEKISSGVRGKAAPPAQAGAQAMADKIKAGVQVKRRAKAAAGALSI